MVAAYIQLAELGGPAFHLAGGIAHPAAAPVRNHRPVVSQNVFRAFLRRAPFACSIPLNAL